MRTEKVTHLRLNYRQLCFTRLPCYGRRLKNNSVMRQENKMDTALQLRIAHDLNQSVSTKDAIDLLSQSKLVNKLISGFIPHNTYSVWRLLALSEIPFAHNLVYTQKIIDYVTKKMGTVNGFSLFGNIEDFLPCYNSMLIEAFSKLGHSNHILVKNGIEWILKYQPINRTSKSTWTQRGIKKYGGCFNEIPCYIGVAKSVKALQSYIKFSNYRKDLRINDFIEEGTEYILSHKLYMRQRDDKPIFKDILSLSFPYNYKLNILELLEIIKEANKLKSSSCKSAIEYLNSRKMDNGFWKIDYNYKAKGYLSFDNKRGKSEWITYLIMQFIRVNA